MVFLFPILLLKIFHLHVNLTTSMPIGFYRPLASPTIRRGDIAAVCLPLPIAKLGLAHHYLLRGQCPGGAIAVIKRIIAVPGDTVTVTDQAMIVNHHVYTAPQQRFDHAHHRIARLIPRGVPVHNRLYWLYGSHDPARSWDSRYYGGVSRAHILGIVTPVWIF